MKIIAVASARPACGQITIAVNLASGLAYRGYKVLIGVTGKNERLRHWLNISPQGNGEKTIIFSEDGTTAKLFRSRLGIDLLEFPSGAEGLYPTNYSPALSKLDHDYLFLLPISREDLQSMGANAGVLIVCSDLATADGLEEMQALEEIWRAIGFNDRGIDLIIPNKINTKEWEHNIGQLTILADYFGYEHIADPIPT